MQKVLIKHKIERNIKGIRAHYCQSYTCKLIGLMFRSDLALDEGLLLVYLKESRLGTAIHMLGVFHELMIIWMDKNLIIVDIKYAKPNRLIYRSRYPASYVLELNISRKNDFLVGDQMIIENVRN